MADQPSISGLAKSATAQLPTSLSNYAGSIGSSISTGIEEISANTAAATSANTSPSGERTSFIPTLSDNTWVANNDNTLATADVYNNGNSTVINSLQSLKDKVTSFFDSNFGGGKGLLSGIVGTLKDIRNLRNTLLKGNLKSRIEVITGLASKALAKAGYAIPQDVLDKVNKTATVAVDIGGTVAKVKAGDMSGLTNATKLLAEYTGDPTIAKISDHSSEAILAADIARTAMKNGLSNSINVIAGKLTSNEAVKQFAADILPDSIKTSDITAITSIATTLGVGNIAGVSPKAIETFCNAYIKPLESAKNDAKKNANDAYVCMNTMQTDWDTLSRTTDTGTATTVNMAPVLNGSTDIKDSFQAYGVNNATVWGMTDAFGLTGSLDVKTALSTQFPTMVSVPGMVTNAAL